MDFLNNRRAFAFVNNGLVVQELTDHRTCQEWLGSSMGITKDQFQSIIRGYITRDRIQFFVGSDYRFCSEVHSGEVLSLQRVYCDTYGDNFLLRGVFNGVRRGKEGEQWEPIREWNSDSCAWDPARSFNLPDEEYLTSDGASKLLKRLQEEYNTLVQLEQRDSIVTMLQSEYQAAKDSGKDIKDYDFAGKQSEMAVLRDRIVKLKHAINMFNTTTELPRLHMTIDQALVYMSFLSNRKKALKDLWIAPEVARSRSGYMRESSDVEVKKFSSEEVKAAYESVCRELSQVQQALNIANTTIPFYYKE